MVSLSIEGMVKQLREKNINVVDDSTTRRKT
jgi:hypothetical protein